MKYLVTFNGEYDLDIDGNVFTCYKICDTLQEAMEEAEDYERRTHCIAPITEVYED